MATVTTYNCDVCGETIQHDEKRSELVTVTVKRPGDDTVVSHLHDECLAENMEGNDFVESLVLHD